MQREKDSSDRRRVVIRPQPMGKIEIFTFMQQEWAKLLSSYNDQELAIILDFVTRSHSVKQEVINKLRVAEASTRRSKPEEVTEK